VSSSSSPSSGIRMTLIFTRRELASRGLLEASAEHVLDALITRAQFIAWGPSVSVEFDTNTIEIECIVDERSRQAAEGRITEIIRQALAACDYSLATTTSSDHVALASV
jgi:hypothetical protein